MQAVPISNDSIQHLVDEGLFDRLPPSFTSFFYQRIADWKLLFPAEQNYIERLFRMLGRSETQLVDELFAPLRQIERKMGINAKTWNPREFTLAHVDFLNRSAHYAEWRAEISRIFSILDPLLDEEAARNGRQRLVFVVSPADLPVGPDRLWTGLRDQGQRVPIDPGEPQDFLHMLLTGKPQAEAERSLVGDLLASPEASQFDAWLIEAGRKLEPFRGERGVWLSYERLESYRERLMEKVNELMNHEKVPGPRELGLRLREMIEPSGDPRIDESMVLEEFLRNVMLAGNGTLLINNTFVEWAAAQAARHARPRLAVVLFGIRNKIKPFSSLLIYADQEKANIIPDQQDMLGSYVDLEALYPYVWRGFEKYAEYRGKTAYLFVSELSDEMLVIAPPSFAPLSRAAPLRLSEIHAACREWLL
jgi:hypothetical protein